MFDEKKELSPSAFSLATGLMSGLALGALSILAIFGKGVMLIEALSDLLIGFDASGAGVLLGIVWGFLLGGIAGFIVAWLYNKMV